MSNKKSVKYTIKDDGFEYHLKKGILKKGSIISLKIHPIMEIEILKKKLRDNNLLKKEKYSYVTKQNIDIGLLVAYNLYKGEIVENVSIQEILLNVHLDNRSVEYDIDNNWKN